MASQPPARNLPCLLPRLNALLNQQERQKLNANNAKQVIVSLTNLQRGLSHVQDGINELLRAYMNHTSSILAGESGQLESLQLPLNAVEAAMSAAAAGSSTVAPAITLAQAGIGATDASKRKRKREKKERDPNAPKRPLTAAFLYSQHARPIVRRDLEDLLPPDGKLEPKAVNNEITRRWNEMPEEEKEVCQSVHHLCSHRINCSYTARILANHTVLTALESLLSQLNGGIQDTVGRIPRQIRRQA